MQNENLIESAKKNGDYLIQALLKIEGVKEVRGRGLMIGFEMETSLSEVRKILLNEFKVFTGEAKPNVIRLLPSLAITKSDIDLFLSRLQGAILYIQQKTN
jgi:acetylornithine aminotransferase